MLHGCCGVAVKTVQGVTLIELMVVVAIIGILSAIVYPSYQQYVQQGRRLDGQRVLLDQAVILERAYARSGRYPEAHAIPAHSFYQFSYVVANAGSGFTLTAQPKSPHSDSECGTLSINAQGVRGSAGGASCWREA